MWLKTALAAVIRYAAVSLVFGVEMPNVLTVLLNARKERNPKADYVDNVQRENSAIKSTVRAKNGQKALVQMDTN